MSSDREQIVHDLNLILGTITSFGTLTLSVGSFDIKPRLINQPCCSFIFLRCLSLECVLSEVLGERSEICCNACEGHNTFRGKNVEFRGVVLKNRRFCGTLFISLQQQILNKM